MVLMTRILLVSAFAVGVLVAGCDALRLFPGSGAAPTPTPMPSSSSPDPGRLVMSPDELVLNVPSDQPCPCPFESTGSFSVSGLASNQTSAWQVLDTSVAAINGSGIVSAVSTGSTEVRLMEGNRMATASIRVLDQGRAAVVVR